MPQSAWARRARRLLLGIGTAGVVWFALGYAAERVREAKARAARERRDRELIKSHFTTLLSTLHYTLYALLPTLEPQLLAAYPVEATSSAIQAGTGSSAEQTPDGSVVLGQAGAAGQAEQAETRRQTEQSSPGLAGGSHTAPSEQAGSPRSVRSGQSGGHELAVPRAGGRADRAGSEVSVDGSWASEFRRRADAEDDMLTASSVSVPMSLPTDVSSSPPRSLSLSSDALSHASPPSQASPPRPRSKKELWRDLKVQSLTRTLSTVYLLPLLYLLTTSQLATLARARYLADVRAALPPVGAPTPAAPRIDDDDDDDAAGAGLRRTASETTIRPEPPARARQWLPGLARFSVAAMGLQEYAAAAESSALNPLRYVRVPAALNPLAYVDGLKAVWGAGAGDEAGAATVFAEHSERALEDAERVFLLYSWWILHEGWRGVAARVEAAVDRVFGSMPLKRELAIDDWDALVRQVRAEVETDGGEAYDLTQHLLPPAPVPAAALSAGCPLPRTPADAPPHLSALLADTRAHLASPDARLVLGRGVDALALALREHVARDVVGLGTDADTAPPPARPARGRARLADVLPAAAGWGRAVWAGVPDNGVEQLLAVPEYETFAALVFGDWAG